MVVAKEATLDPKLIEQLLPPNRPTEKIHNTLWLSHQDKREQRHHAPIQWIPIPVGLEQSSTPHPARYLDPHRR